MNVLISGSSGFVGNFLLQELFKMGYTVHSLQRNSQYSHGEDSSDIPYWNHESLDTGTPIDAVIHLAGENVASGKWNQKKKEKILRSRLDSTRTLIDHIATLEKKPKIFFCASAIGYYGNRSDELLDEQSSFGSGFLADVTAQWEKETERLRQYGVRVVNLRFGMILGPGGGGMAKMIPPFKKGVGGVLGSGTQYMSWISIRDIPFIIDHIIHDEKISGPVNMVSPYPLQNKDFTKVFGKALGVKTFMKAPAFLIKVIFGQMGEEMLLASTRVTPKVLQDSGYQFIDTDLEQVLRYCIKNENN